MPIYNDKTQKLTVKFLLVFVPFLMGIGVDLYIPSLPAITDFFQTKECLVQLTVSFYMLSYGIGQIFFGPLIDSFGRKKILSICAAFYVVFSLLAAFSPSIYLLIMYRFLQGLAVAGMSVAIRAVATDSFSDLALAKAMNNISISWALGPIVGPFIGGYLQRYFGWQANFYFFSLYSLLIAICTILMLSETSQRLFPLNFLTFINAAKKICSNISFVLYSIILSIAYGSLVIFNIIGPFLIQSVLKYSAVDYGHLALILGLAYFLGNTFNRLVITHFAPIKIALFGIISTLFMSIMMLALGFFTKINLYVVVIPAWLLFLSCGFIFPNIAFKFFTIFSNELAGTANAIGGFLMVIWVFFFSSFATTLKTTSQIPMAIIYIAISSLSLLLFFIVQKLGNSGKKR